MTREEKIEILEKEKAYMLAHGGDRQAEALTSAIKALEQEPKWISVSERLPEDSDEYLVSVIDGSEEDNNYKAVGVAWFAHKKDYGIKESEWRELGIDETVIAWMPLPAPFELQESEG